MIHDIYKRNIQLPLSCNNSATFIPSAPESKFHRLSVSNKFHKGNVFQICFYKYLADGHMKNKALLSHPVSHEADLQY